MCMSFFSISPRNVMEKVQREKEKEKLNVETAIMNNQHIKMQLIENQEREYDIEPPKIHIVLTY